MTRSAARRRNGIVLLATMAFLLVAVSFHSAGDNDFAGAGAAPRCAALPAPDNCPACALDGLVTVRLSLLPPMAPPTFAERLESPVPASPFVAPRASVDSRPPPAAA